MSSPQYATRGLPSSNEGTCFMNTFEKGLLVALLVGILLSVGDHIKREINHNNERAEFLEFYNNTLKGEDVSCEEEVKNNPFIPEALCLIDEMINIPLN